MVKWLCIVLFVLEKMLTSLVVVANASLQLPNSDEQPFILDGTLDLCDEPYPIGDNCPLPANSTYMFRIYTFSESTYRKFNFAEPFTRNLHYSFEGTYSFITEVFGVLEILILNLQITVNCTCVYYSLISK